MDKIKTIEDIKNTIENYEWLKEKAKNIIPYDADITYIEDLYLADDENIEIYGSSIHCGYNYTESTIVPIKWLFLDEKELKQAKEERHQTELKEKERKKQEKIEKEKREQEAKDLAEYERLKKKYES